MYTNPSTVAHAYNTNNHICMFTSDDESLESDFSCNLLRLHDTEWKLCPSLRITWMRKLVYLRIKWFHFFPGLRKNGLLDK